MRHPYPRASLYAWKRALAYGTLTALFLLITGLLAYSHYFGPVDEHAEVAEFTITADTGLTQAAQQVADAGFVKSAWALRIALAEEANGHRIRPGGYKIGKGMDAWTVAKTLVSPPALAFITFPPHLRKEQMGSMLAEALNWTEAQEREWNTVATNPDPEFAEGVYYPDTYLIPSDQSPAQIAARMRGRFTDVFAPYAAEAQAQGIPWTKVLTLASIVDREAGKTDKALVAGILWNRLQIGMKLQADATLQYIKGNEEDWWPAPRSEDKYLESPFNTYQHAGLPPHPIDNPTAESVAAVLHPVDTDCLYYLHDAGHRIHCSLTYAGQKANVNKYLR